MPHVVGENRLATDVHAGQAGGLQVAHAEHQAAGVGTAPAAEEDGQGGRGGVGA